MLCSSLRVTRNTMMSIQHMGMATRVPSIKFTHGLRSEITKEMMEASGIPPSHFAPVGHGSTKTASPVAAPSMSTGPVAGKTVVVGGRTTKTLHYGEMYGNPFDVKPSIEWTEDVCSLITLGGAPADPPKKDPKDAKKGGKK